MRRVQLGLMVLAGAVGLVGNVVGADGYEQWMVVIGMIQWHEHWGSDGATWFGVHPEATGMYDGRDAVHCPVVDPEHDLAWIYVADQGGDGGWDEFTGEYEEYPPLGLCVDMRAPYGPGTAQPHVGKRTWAVEVHAPNGPEYTWDLVWHINPWEGWRLPEYPFVVRILPNLVFPEGLDLTSYGDGLHYIRDIPQFGPEPQIWLIEGVIVPEPGLTCVAAAIPLALAALRGRWPGARRSGASWKIVDTV